MVLKQGLNVRELHHRLCVGELGNCAGRDKRRQLDSLQSSIAKSPDQFQFCRAVDGLSDVLEAIARTNLHDSH
jgi:hypothetical protein